MRHAHASGASHKASEDNIVQLEHADDVTEEGRCNCGPMCRGDFQSCGERRGRVHRGCGGVQVYRAAAGPVRLKLVGGPLEHREGESSMGPFRKVTT